EVVEDAAEGDARAPATTAPVDEASPATGGAGGAPDGAAADGDPDSPAGEAPATAGGNGQPALRARLRELETTPPPSRVTKLVPWAVLVLVLAGFAIGFLRSPEEGLRLLTDWTDRKSTLAGIGTPHALAQPIPLPAAPYAR